MIKFLLGTSLLWSEIKKTCYDFLNTTGVVMSVAAGMEEKAEGSFLIKHDKF